MTAFESWRGQRERLRESLKDCADTAAVAYAVRRALAQAEQNTMAGQSDDLLRQQTGILFGCVKASAQLLDVSVSAQLWVARSEKKEKGGANPLLWALAGLAQLGAWLWGYYTSQLLSWVLTTVAFLSALAAWIAAGRRERKRQPEDETRMTLRPDADKLLQVLDGQMHAIDRFMNDFAYLNEQTLGERKAPDGKAVALAASMLEALYGCDGEAREAVGAAAGRMLLGLGMEAAEYSEETKKLFTTLPSKTETRTMAPAILSAEDHRLLKRGVAAVRLEQEALA